MALSYELEDSDENLATILSADPVRQLRSFWKSVVLLNPRRVSISFTKLPQELFHVENFRSTTGSSRSPSNASIKLAASNWTIVLRSLTRRVVSWGAVVELWIAGLLYTSNSSLATTLANLLTKSEKIWVNGSSPGLYQAAVASRYVASRSGRRTFSQSAISLWACRSSIRADSSACSLAWRLASARSMLATVCSANRQLS